MAYKLNTSSKNKFEALFLNCFGGGWQKKIHETIAIYIYPESLSILTNSASWNSSNSEILFIKNNIKASVMFDDYDTISLITNDENCTLELFEIWVKLIDKKVQDME